MELFDVKNVLLTLGLSNWEVEAYIILVRYGPQTAVDLSRLSKVARSKTYEVVTRLRRKGLVMKVPPMPTKGITQKFVAINPQEVFQNKMSEIEKASKYLSLAYKNPKKVRYPNINFYTTKDNARKFLMRLPKESNSFNISLTTPAIKRVLGFSFDNWINSLNKKKSRFILSKDYLDISKKIKSKSFSSIKNSMSYIITPDRLILDLWDEQHIILDIQSKEAANTFSSQFRNIFK